MGKKSTRKVKVEVVREAEHRGTKGTEFRYEGALYFVPFWRAGELSSVHLKSIGGRLIPCIISKEDLGGCGNDALKGVVKPISHWLKSHCESLPEAVSVNDVTE